MGGQTYGSFATTFDGDSDNSNFLAVALDEDGNELWRWQVKVVPEMLVLLLVTSNMNTFQKTMHSMMNRSSMLVSYQRTVPALDSATFGASLHLMTALFYLRVIQREIGRG